MFLNTISRVTSPLDIFMFYFTVLFFELMDVDMYKACSMVFGEGNSELLHRTSYKDRKFESQH